ncbi:MAG: hypothetical protein IJI03_18835 [Rudaea sp.]|nr:hypothetical protein [Rudaea sp.]
MRQRIADGQVAGLAAHDIDSSPAKKSSSDSSSTPDFHTADGGSPASHASPSSAAFSSEATPSPSNASPPAAGSSKTPGESATSAQSGPGAEAWRGLRRVAENGAEESVPRSTASSNTLDASRIAPDLRRVDDEAIDTAPPSDDLPTKE